MNSKFSFYYKAPVEFITESLALFARMTTQPTTKQKLLINETIKALKNGNIWDLLDVLVLLHSHNVQAAYLNWKQAAYNAIPVNSPVFTPYSNVKTAISKYINTDFIPVLNSKYKLNDAMYGVKVFGNIITTATITMGAGAASRMFRINASNQFIGSVNTSTNTYLRSTYEDNIGLYIAQITNNLGKLFKDGIKKTEQSYSGVILPTSQFTVGNTDYANYQSYFIGASLTEQQQSNFNAIINNYIANYSNE